MPEILNKTRNDSGFVLLSSLLVMSLLLLLATYVINFTLTEFKISVSHSTATQAYYLAESGVAEAIWRLKNDPTWKNNFETNPTWSITVTRSSALYPNGSYTISIVNSALAQGQITVTSSLGINGKFAKRVIKTTGYKTLGGTTPIGDNAEFGDGNIDISGSVLNVYGGGIHSNGNIIVNYWSAVTASGDVKATGNINEHNNSTIIANSKQSNAAPIAMPSISFDEYRATANNVFTQGEFDSLLWNNPSLTIYGTNYVDGNVEIKGNQSLTINGVLVASGNITVGKVTVFCCWGLRCGTSNVTISKASIGRPSGLIAKGRIDFELCLGGFTANGVVYANDKINVLSIPSTFSVIGGMISRKYTMTSAWQGVSIEKNAENLTNVLGGASFSPIITVDHWEEEY